MNTQTISFFFAIQEWVNVTIQSSRSSNSPSYIYPQKYEKLSGEEGGAWHVIHCKQLVMNCHHTPVVPESVGTLYVSRHKSLPQGT